MNTRKISWLFVLMALATSLPFVILHLTASPDDARITPLQHVVAAMANYFGPWGVLIVRLVDFPNAGLRSFNWFLAIGLTLVGGVLLVLSLKVARIDGVIRQVFLFLSWGLFLFLWFAVGLRQIADGLL